MNEHFHNDIRSVAQGVTGPWPGPTGAEEGSTPPPPTSKRQSGQTRRWNPSSMNKTHGAGMSLIMHGMCPHCPRVDLSTPNWTSSGLKWLLSERKRALRAISRAISGLQQVCSVIKWGISYLRWAIYKKEVDHLWQRVGPSSM